MKRFLIIFLVSLFIGSRFVFPQEVLMNCVAESIQNYDEQTGGYALPSQGTINSLFVFVQFPDDNYDVNNPYWVKGQAPANINSWVNQTWTNNPIQGSMTHYFNDMSFDKLKFTGKTVSVITPHTRQWYLDNNKSRGYIHKEVIQQLDQTWDFAQFDNWDLNSTYNFTNQPDGIIDMIFMIWRNIGNEFTGSQRSLIYNKLDFPPVYSEGDLGGSSFTVDNGTRTVKTGFAPSASTPGGSGVTLNDHLINQGIKISVHEFAHYLLGNNSYHSGYGFWGMLSAYGHKSIVANSFERVRLGWIDITNRNFDPNSGTKLNKTLGDYVTTGEIYRLNIGTNQYFYIENHQKLSYWETHLAPGNIENGIYILRQDGETGNNVQIIPADGRYDWAVNQLVDNPYGTNPDSLPVFKNLTPDRQNGYHDLLFIPWTYHGVQETSEILFTEDENGDPVQDTRYHGDGKDAFRLGYNDTFSPWSNPIIRKRIAQVRVLALK